MFLELNITPSEIPSKGILFVDHSLNRFEAEEVLKKFNLPPLQV